jgi:hypothetical protein
VNKFVNIFVNIFGIPWPDIVIVRHRASDSGKQFHTSMWEAKGHNRINGADAGGMGWDGMGWDGMGWDGMEWIGLDWIGLDGAEGMDGIPRGIRDRFDRN